MRPGSPEGDEGPFGYVHESWAHCLRRRSTPSLSKFAIFRFDSQSPSLVLGWGRLNRALPPLTTATTCPYGSVENSELQGPGGLAGGARARAHLRRGGGGALRGALEGDAGGEGRRLQARGAVVAKMYCCGVVCGLGKDVRLLNMKPQTCLVGDCPTTGSLLLCM